MKTNLLLKSINKKGIGIILMMKFLHFLGAILVPAPTNIGSTELQRRISLSKPSCFVSSGVIENDLLDVIDQVSIPSVDLVKLENIKS